MKIYENCMFTPILYGTITRAITVQPFNDGGSYIPVLKKDEFQTIIPSLLPLLDICLTVRKIYKLDSFKEKNPLHFLHRTFLSMLEFKSFTILKVLS